MNSNKIRLLAQGSFLAFMTWTGYRHQVLGGGPQGVPPVDALCPLGGMETLFGFLSSGTWLRRVAPSALVLFVLVVIATLLFGSAAAFRGFANGALPAATNDAFKSANPEIGKKTSPRTSSTAGVRSPSNASGTERMARSRSMDSRSASGSVCRSGRELHVVCWRAASSGW